MLDVSSSSVKADFCLPADVNILNAHFAGDPVPVTTKLEAHSTYLSG